MGYVFRSGRVIHFVGGQFTTSNQDEIDELTKECNASPNGNYYIDPQRVTIDPNELDPMAVIYAKMLEKARAEVAAATNPDRDMGTTAQGKLEGIANSSSIRGLAVESSAEMAPVTKGVAGPIKVATATKL